MNPSSSNDQSNNKSSKFSNEPKSSSVEYDSEKMISISICRALKTEREKQKISQQRLAQMADISRTGLRHIESLEICPTLFSLLKVSQALGLELSDLLRNLDR